MPEDLYKPFKELYGSKGKWVRLFEDSNDYISTELVRDTSEPSTYLTIDKWKSLAG